MSRSFGALLAAAVSGSLFGVGLAISGMIDPRKVLNFLDFAAMRSGGWDPSLAFVMLGGVVVMFFGLRFDRIVGRPFAAAAFQRPGLMKIDRALVVGAALFGIGWGLAGLCPGPALADLGLIPRSVGVFVVAMLLASWTTGLVLQRTANRNAPPASE